MRVYVGQTRSRKLIAKLSALGYGECTQPREMPPRRVPWFLDNAAFSAWRSGQPFDGEGYELALRRAADLECLPDFVVAPDIVASGAASLAFSLEWLPTLRSTLRAPAYLVAQDGMTEGDVGSVLGQFDGLFVGGSLEWKLRTSAAWVEFAHQHGVPCHVGRVGTPKRVAWARRIGVDSIDSCEPLWSAEKMERFAAAVEGRQGDLIDMLGAEAAA